MQRIAQRAFHPTAIHAVVGLGVADGRFNGLSSFEQALFIGTERLVLASMDDQHAWVVGIDPSIAQIDHHLFGLAPEVLQQMACLLELVDGHGALDPEFGRWQGPRPQQSDRSAGSDGAVLWIRA